VDPGPPQAEGTSDPLRDERIRDHLANERTLLAWQRTALTVMGLGVLVDRVALGGAGAAQASLVGLVLIVIGGGVAALGTYRFVRMEREIETATYRPALAVHLVLSGAVILGGLLLAVFLFTSAR
jgi:putative membrane protein